LSLTFKQLSIANWNRNNEKFSECRAWSLCDWVTCLVGEVGEAANIVKKMKLGRYPCKGTAETPIFEGPEDATKALASELADTQIYLDLLANSAGVDLESAVREKFNQKSKELQSKITL
jgi:NTP pyrophosphatase (non-canonical NTP hydrolase)